MKATQILAAALTLTALGFTTRAQADFSYKVTRKTGGAMANQGPQVSTHLFKGQKMKIDNGNTATILDFDAQTITTIDNNAKTYTVRNFSDLGGGHGTTDAEAKIDVKEAGQKKVVNGFTASEIVMTMDVDNPQARQMGNMQMEMDMWISPDVPGVGQLREFYQRNGTKFPWTAVAGGGNAGMQKAMADLQRKMSSMNGVPVESVMRVKQAGGAAGMPQMSDAQTAQMAQARGRMEAMIAQGGPQAAAMKQALARMPGGAAMSGSGSGAIIEVTMDSSDFSATSIPDSVFAVPDGYRKGN